ncbi:ferredoxin [Micromonospora sp. HNM0581]|uniref:ferredoxin n=1 Tax=Micromonospora sp. HNM0581 TaxID=2716341 RepID=UPI00146F874E|nr:ferredoxin [Micromonospora sp. HNM0581]NLU79140.1 ferredoxin [Micromonospora sp. HNM0581]
MRVTANADICVGAGQCVLAAPTVFDQSDEDGRVLVMTVEVTDEQAEAVRTAADWCPSGAVVLISR